MRVEDLPTAQAIESALDEKDEDKRWDWVTALHKRGTGEVFEAAKSLCESREARKISLGADVLGQLGTPALPFKEETLPVLLKLADSDLQTSENEDEMSALQSVVFALGRMEDEAARARILNFVEHPSEDVRYAAVFGLLTIDEDAAIDALIRLSKDEDADVRNWATFGLGSQIDRDTEEIREALFERLDEVGGDVEREIRGEALVGLARRKDDRVIEPLLKCLAGDSVGMLDVEAAAEIGDERLCEALLKLNEWWDDNDFLLKEALENCCGSEKQRGVETDF